MPCVKNMSKKHFHCDSIALFHMSYSEIDLRASQLADAWKRQLKIKHSVQEDNHVATGQCNLLKGEYINELDT